MSADGFDLPGDDHLFCPFCGCDCGPDYSDYSDHVYDEHPDKSGVWQPWA